MPTNFKVTGHVISAGELRSGTGQKGEWKSQEFLIGFDTNETYPKKMLLSCFGADKIKKITDLKQGENAEFYFNIDVNEYQGKYYGKNNLWKVERIGDVVNDPVSSISGESDTLPF